MESDFEFFAVASGGTGIALESELKRLGLKKVKLSNGGVSFRGRICDGWRACLYSRVAQRIQLVLKRFEAANEKSLYDGAKDFDWQRYISPEKSISVHAAVVSGNLTHSGYVALKTKDAVVDNIREVFGKRPDVDREDADVRIFVYIFKNIATLYLDMSGDSLFKRGYRIESGDAPLKETVAAAMIIYSGWDMNETLWDPMCGSGTIPIEAAMIAANIAPGIFRKKFGFERWANFDSDSEMRIRTMRGEARKNIKMRTANVIGTDCDEKLIQIAKENARRAGVRISFKKSFLEDFNPDGAKRLILINPPYNKRLAADIELYRKIASFLSCQHGSTAGILSANIELLKQIPLKCDAEFDIKNGSLDCIFRLYNIP